MPDSTSLPGLAPLRSRQANVGGFARPERGEPRWRDIQWVDFTSDPDSAAAPSASHSVVPAIPANPPRMQRGAPGLGGALKHFVRPAAATSDRREVIPGLATRFRRLPVSRLPAAKPPTRPVSLKAEPRRSPAPLPLSREPASLPPATKLEPVIVRPRIPDAPPDGAADSQLVSAAAPERSFVPPGLVPPPAPPPTEPSNRPFPASISTSVSVQVPAAPAPESAWRQVFVRHTQEAAQRLAASAGRAVGRVHGMPRPAIPKIPRLPMPGGAVFVRLRRTVNGVGGF